MPTVCAGAHRDNPLTYAESPHAPARPLDGERGALKFNRHHIADAEQLPITYQPYLCLVGRE